MTVLGGNMRLKACKAAGMFEVPIDIQKGLTTEQKRRFIIKDNSGFGEWDWDILANEWDVKQLTDWGVDLPVFDLPIDDEPKEVTDEPKEVCELCGK
jgi:ParB-like chromosome segregation protein Spo0J